MSNENCVQRGVQANVLETTTLAECSNDKTRPVGIDGPLVAKIPVVIAEPVIQVDVESIIQLEEPALEIKRIKKNVYLTQCKLLNTRGPKSGKLFISGFVRKNIEYATALEQSAENGAISGDIRHSTIRVPFDCVTEVEYINPPITFNTGVTKEIELFTNKIVGCDPCAQNIMGRNPCEQDFEHYESFTDRVYCQLVDVKIFEEDIHQDPEFLGCELPTEQVFQRFVEKMVLYIRIKVLQNQQVNIPKEFKFPEKVNSAIFYDCGRKWSYKNGAWRPHD